MDTINSEKFCTGQLHLSLNACARASARNTEFEEGKSSSRVMYTLRRVEREGVRKTCSFYFSMCECTKPLSPSPKKRRRQSISSRANNSRSGEEEVKIKIWFPLHVTSLSNVNTTFCCYCCRCWKLLKSNFGSYRYTSNLLAERKEIARTWRRKKISVPPRRPSAAAPCT